LIINNPHLKKALEYFDITLSSSIDPSGAVFYPEYYRKNFTFNDLTQEGAIIGVRVEGPSNSVDHRIKRLCKELDVLNNEFSILDQEQSNIFWEKQDNYKFLLH